MRLGVLLFISLLFFPVSIAYGWSNGGSYSTSPSNPVIGTHDWIVEKAVILLPMSESKVYADNLNWLKYGTELPDRPKAQGGYGDFYNHHVYFDEQHRPAEDAAATRANETYREALDLLKQGNFSGGVMLAGAMSHYISDMAVWGHMMGNDTVWGKEQHHDDYESYVNEHMFLYEQSIMLLEPFKQTTAYQATMDLASDIMFNTPNATWMDAHYNWSDPQFKTRVAGSLNLAANYVANVFHTLWLDAGEPIPELPQITPILVIALVTVLVMSKRASASRYRLNKN